MAASAVQGARRIAANVRCVQPFMRPGSVQNGGALGRVERREIRDVVTGMRTPMATTCNAHRWIQGGRRRGHTSKSPKAAVADRPTIMVRRNSEDGELLHPRAINRRPTVIDIVSATATRRVVFTTRHSSSRCGG